VGIGRYFAGAKVMGHKVNYLHPLLPKLRMCGSVPPLGHVTSLHAHGQIYLYGGITRFSALSMSLLSGQGQGYMPLEDVFDPLPFGTSEMPSFRFLEHLHLKDPHNSRIINLSSSKAFLMATAAIRPAHRR